MQYIEKMLGISLQRSNDSISELPNFILDRYSTELILLDNVKTVFICPKTELEPINTVKKHIDKIRIMTGLPVVLVADNISYRQREYMIKERISFIVDEKQIYLPFMAIHLQEKFCKISQVQAEILPSAQLLLLYYIYNGCGELFASDASLNLKLTPTSISRASKQLEAMNLIKTRTAGVQKILYSDYSPEEMFSVSKDKLQSPVKRVIYIPKDAMGDKMYLSGYSALAEYSFVNPSSVLCLATDSISKWDGISTSVPDNTNEQCAVEFWRYDPGKLTNSKYVDRLSLALSIGSNADERTQEGIENMLKEVWREIDGNRS